MGIALTLSGFIVILMKKKAALIDFDLFGTGVSNSNMQPVFDFTTDYQAILFVLYIPMMASASWLAYDKVKYNFTERLTIFIYALAQFSILTFLPSILILTFSPENYAKLSLPLMGVMYLYSGWVIQRTGKLKRHRIYLESINFLCSIYYSIFSFIYAHPYFSNIHWEHEFSRLDTKKKLSHLFR